MKRTKVRKIKECIFTITKSRRAISIIIILILALISSFNRTVNAMEFTPLSTLEDKIQNTNAGIVNLNNNGYATLILHQVGGDFAKDNYAIMEGRVSVYDSSNQLIKSINLFDVDSNNFVNGASIAQLKNGGFVVAWTNLNATWNTTTTYAYCQVFDNIGNKIGSTQKISNLNSSGSYRNINVIGRSDGGFAIVFTSRIASNDLATLVTYSHDNGSYTKVRESNIGGTSVSMPSEFSGNVKLFMSFSHPKVIELLDGSMIVEDYCYVQKNPETLLGDFVFKFDRNGLPTNFRSGYSYQRINYNNGYDYNKGFDIIALSDGGFATVNSNQPDGRVDYADWEIGIYETDGTARISKKLTSLVYYTTSGYTPKQHYGKIITSNIYNEIIWESSSKLNVKEIDGGISVVLYDDSNEFTEFIVSKMDGSIISSEDWGMTVTDNGHVLIHPYRIKLPNDKWLYTFEDYYFDSDNYITSTVYLANNAVKSASAISVKTQPTKLTYTEGEALDLSGLVATLTYNDGTSEDIAFADFGTNDITANPANGTVLTNAAHNSTKVTITHTPTGQTTQTNNLTVTEVSESTPTVPGKPTNLTTTKGNGRITLKFTAPAEDGGSVITGYKVDVYIGATFVKTVDTSKSPVTITGLINGTEYNFKARAVNSVGESLDSEASAPIKPSTVPSSPTNVNAVAGNGQATITFTPPTNDGGSEITEYIVIAEPGGITVTTTGSPVTVTGLTNGKTYKFTIKAKNAAGTSVPAYSNSVTIGD